MKKAVMYGAGNIGRGFIGPVFSASDYEVVFIDVNMDIVSKLNEDGHYPVVILKRNEAIEMSIEHVHAVNGLDMNSVTLAIAEADIMATAVGVSVLPKIAEPIAKGLARRWELNNYNPLNILICENLLHADRYLAGLIKECLNEQQKLQFDELIGLVESSIGRMVPVMTPIMQKGNLLRVCVEEYGELPVDKAAFKGNIPLISNMKPVSPFDFYIQRKLYIHNMGHALTAYLGYMKGYRFIWEAIMDPSIKYAVAKAMQASAIALAKEHGMELDNLLNHVDDLIYRFANKQLGDTIQRVGNDTRRKLAPSDRLIGAANLCVSKGINPSFLCLGVAAAMNFNTEQDSGIQGVYGLIEKEGVASVLKSICELEPGSFLSNSIMQFYSLFKNGQSMDEMIEVAEELKRCAVI